MMIKVYVYKEFNDSDAYGEEIIEVYRDRNKAISHLNERAKRALGYSPETSWNQIIHELELDAEEDTFNEEYVSIGSYYNGVLFFLVEEHEVIE